MEEKILCWFLDVDIRIKWHTIETYGTRIASKIRLLDLVQWTTTDESVS